MKQWAALLALMICAAPAAACEMTYADVPGVWDTGKYDYVINGSGGACSAIGVADGIKCCLPAGATGIGNFSQVMGKAGMTFAVPYFSANFTFDATALSGVGWVNVGLVNASGVNDVMGNVALGKYGIAWMQLSNVGGARLYCHDGSDGGNKANAAKPTLNHTVEFSRGVGDTAITAKLINATGSVIALGSCPYTDTADVLYPAASVHMQNAGTNAAGICVQLHSLDVKSQINVSGTVYVNNSLGEPQAGCLVETVATLGEDYPGFLNTSAAGLAGPFIMSPSCAQGVKWSGYYAVTCAEGDGFTAGAITIADTPQVSYLQLAGGPNGTLTQSIVVSYQNGDPAVGSNVSLEYSTGEIFYTQADGDGRAAFTAPAGRAYAYASNIPSGYARQSCLSMIVPTGTDEYCTLFKDSVSADIVINASNAKADLPLSSIMADTYLCGTSADCIGNLGACEQQSISRQLDAGGDAAYPVSGSDNYVCVSLRNSGVPNQAQLLTEGATLTYAFDLGGGKTTEYCLAAAESFAPNAAITNVTAAVFAPGSAVAIHTALTDNAGMTCFNSTSTDGLFQTELQKTGYEYLVVTDNYDALNTVVFYLDRIANNAIKNSTITAIVTLNGSAVGGQTMRLICEGSPRMAQTNATGYAVWANATSGTECYIDVDGGRYAVLTGGYWFTVSGDHTITVTLQEKSAPAQQRRTITASATDADDGFGISGAAFTASSRLDGETHACTTGSGGSCDLVGLYKDVQYSVTASQVNYADWTGTIASTQTAGINAQMTSKAYEGGKCAITVSVQAVNGSLPASAIKAEILLKDTAGGITQAASSSSKKKFIVACGTHWTAEARYMGALKSEKVTAPAGRGQSVSITLQFGSSAPDREADKTHFMDTVWGMMPVFELIFVLLVLSIVMMGVRSMS